MSTAKNYTIYVEQDATWPNQREWIVVVFSEDQQTPLGRIEGVSAYDVMGEAAKIIDKAAVPA